jgi:hypothetical protein
MSLPTTEEEESQPLHNMNLAELRHALLEHLLEASQLIDELGDEADKLVLLPPENAHSAYLADMVLRLGRICNHYQGALAVLAQVNHDDSV